MSRQKSISRRDTFALAAGAAALPLAGAALTAGPARAQAPMQGAARPSHYRVGLGQFEVTTIFDGAVQLDGPHPIFGENQTAEAVQALARENFLPETRQEIGFTPVVVNTGSALVVFDTGNGARRRPNAGKLAAALGNAGYSPDQVDVVVLTHFHPDHIGGLMEDGQPLFANARYVAPSTEYDFWTHPDRMSGPTEGVATLTAANVKPLAEKMTFIGNEGEVVPGIRGISAFGHTPGHTAFHIESDGRRLLLGGDFCNHYVVSMQVPDWHVRFDMDKEGAVASRKSLLDLLATDRIPFTSYHMPFPAVGYVERKGQGYRYVPASYQLHL
ncbi:MAG: MBL fold metallo-hydrolase [Inquilinus sp.]|nr:MBL fold metallo-hydrolase [Inquilinus sp.]